MDPLDKAQQNESLGWDHDEATQSVRQAMRILKMTTRSVEKHYNDWLRDREDNWDTTYNLFIRCCKGWNGHIKGMRGKDGGDASQAYYNQLKALQSSVNRLNEMMCLSPAILVKMGKDLSSITKDIVGLLEKVDKLHKPATVEDEEASLHESLLPEQRVQLHRWLKENENDDSY